MIRDDTQVGKTGKIVLVDVAPVEVSVKNFAGNGTEPQTAGSLDSNYALPAPAPNKRPEPQRISDIDLWQQFADEFERTVLGAGMDLEKTIFVLGTEHDPLVPSPGTLGISLRIIEFLAKIGPRLLCIQTRSPLIVLALPVLKALKRRACVVMYLETRDDRNNARLTSHLPRPSERIRTLRLLKKTGIAVVAAVQPPEQEQGLATYAMLLNELHLPVIFGRSGEASEALRRYYLRLGAVTPVESVIEHLHLSAEHAQMDSTPVSYQAA